jgi:hypothetical protein
MHVAADVCAKYGRFCVLFAHIEKYSLQTNDENFEDKSTHTDEMFLRNLSTLDGRNLSVEGCNVCKVDEAQFLNTNIYTFDA